MKYLYYPGCSLEGTAREYDLSTRAIMRSAGVDLLELEDWTCCGASAAAATSYMLSLALPARNLALAEKMGDGMEVLVPCSACYLNLKKVEEKIKKDPELLARLNTILKAEGLQLSGKVRVRHLLDVIANDLGPELIRSLAKKSLGDLTVAPYYGCQCLRPYAVFDDPEKSPVHGAGYRGGRRNRSLLEYGGQMLRGFPYEYQNGGRYRTDNCHTE